MNLAYKPYDAMHCKSPFSFLALALQYLLSGLVKQGAVSHAHDTNMLSGSLMAWKTKMEAQTLAAFI